MGKKKYHNRTFPIICPWCYQELKLTMVNVGECPHCRQRLPQNWIEKSVDGTLLIPIIGISGSGKTMYIRELLRTIHDVMPHVGYQVLLSDEARGFLTRNNVKPGVAMPIGTASAESSVPIPLYLKRERKGKTKSCSIIIRDISGSECICRNEYTLNLIHHANGIILLIDPQQFPYIATMGQLHQDDIRVARFNAGTDESSPEVVLDALYANFGNPQNIPLALCFSKSMFFRKLIGDQSFSDIFYSLNQSVFREISWTDEKAFHSMQYQCTRAELRNLYEQHGSSCLEKAKSIYRNVGLFAVESLGTNTKTIVKNGECFDTVENEPCGSRVCEPLIWILSELDFIPSADI